MGRWLMIAGSLAACSTPSTPSGSSAPGASGAAPGSGASDAVAIDAPTRADVERQVRASVARQVVAIEALECPAGDLASLARFECMVAFTAVAHGYRWTRATGGRGVWTTAIERHAETVTIDRSSAAVMARFRRLSFGAVSLTELPVPVRRRIEHAFIDLQGEHVAAVECPAILADVPSPCTVRVGSETWDLELVVHVDGGSGTLKLGWRTRRPPGGRCSDDDHVDPRDPDWCRPAAYHVVLNWDS